VKQQGLLVRIVGVSFERPCGLRGQQVPDLLFKRRAEYISNVCLRPGHQGFKTLQPLLVAGCLFRSLSAAEAEEFTVDDDVDVFGEAIDQLPPLGQRRSALERQVRARDGQAEQSAERPAHPEVLLHAAGAEAEATTRLFVDDPLAFDGLREEGVHHFTEGFATRRRTSPTHVGA